MAETPMAENHRQRTRRRQAMKTRRLERAHLIYFLRVFDAMSGDLLGQMVDLTSDGIMVIGESAIIPRQKYRLRMDLPRNVAIGQHLTLDVQCKWCRRDPSADFYSMGFHILDMSPQAHQIVDQLVQKFYREAGGEDPEADMNPQL